MFSKSTSVAVMFLMIFSLLLSTPGEAAQKKEKGKSKAAERNEKKQAKRKALKEKNPELFKFETQAESVGDELKKVKDQTKAAKDEIKAIKDKAKGTPEAEQKKLAEEYGAALRKMYELQEKQMELRVKIGETKLEIQRIRTGLLKEQITGFKADMETRIEKDKTKLFKAGKRKGGKGKKGDKEGKPLKDEAPDKPDTAPDKPDAADDDADTPDPDADTDLDDDTATVTD